jgi:hypothetical protein
VAQVTEYDPTTLKRVPNHDAQRRQRELEEALAKINQGNTQVVQPGQSTPEPPVPVEAGQIDPATALSETVIELPTPPAEIAEPVVAEPTPPTIPIISAEELAKLQKGYREAQQALTPALQKAAALQNRLKEEQETTKAELKTLREMLAEMATTIKQQNTPPPPPVYRPEEDEELAYLDPVIADRFRRFSQGTQESLAALERKHQAEIQSIRDQEKTRLEALANEQAMARQQNWNETFVRLVPDYQDYLPEGSKGHALAEWANQMPAEYMQAIGNPFAHTPFFVAMVINQFKSSLAPTATPARQPKPGDLATRSLGAAPVKIVPPQPEVPLSADQIRNAQKIMDGLMREATNLKNSKEVREQKAAEAQDFMARFERLAPK